MSDKTPEQLEKEIKDIDEAISIIKSKQALKQSKCRICGLKGCEIVSFKEKGPVHIVCHLDS